MKRLPLFLILLAAGLAAGWLFLPQPTAASPRPQTQVQSGPAVLCMPGVYFYDPGDCVPAGPSTYLTNLAQKGLALPLAPLPSAPPDPTLSDTDVFYGEVRNLNAPIYGSIEDARAANKKAAVQRLNGDFVYISYTETSELDGRRFYLVGPGQWMTANDVSRVGVLPRFQGLEFKATPSNDFGWVLTYWLSEPLQTKRTPGNELADYTGHVLKLLDVVQVYDLQNVAGEDWLMVGPDEWVPRKFVARVMVDAIPPEGATGDRWIEVNLQEQTLAVYDKRQLVFATLIATGADPFWTRPGLFQIYDKKETTPMRGPGDNGIDAYYLEDVPWTLYYDDARALHGAYWRAKLGYPQSHGCVNMTIGDSHWIFDWAQIGDWVYVWDPSGQTPTDPSLYGSGGY